MALFAGIAPVAGIPSISGIVPVVGTFPMFGTSAAVGIPSILDSPPVVGILSILDIVPDEGIPSILGSAPDVGIFCMSPSVGMSPSDTLSSLCPAISLFAPLAFSFAPSFSRRSLKSTACASNSTYVISLPSMDVIFAYAYSCPSSRAGSLFSSAA